jgi:glycosyltransferase involved in cell wall biosynthesis
VNAPANRTYEHCREWVAAGHDVHVITCVPSHPLGRPFPGYRRRWYQRETVDGIQVHRVWTWLAPNRGTVWRIVNYLSFVPAALFRAIRLGRFDIVVGTSPQFFCAVAAWIASRLGAGPWVFELRDLWPDSIVAVGAMRKSWALSALERLELKLYQDAAAVVSVTNSFVRNLTHRGVDPSKLHMIPNGIVPSFWTTGDRQAERTAAGLEESDIVVSYIGTVGMAHGLGTVLDAAAALAESAPHVKFWIVGDGAELEALRQCARERGLTTVRFTGLVERGRIPSLLAASDISLVTLRPSDVFKTVLPSKMFESMAAGVPIVLGVGGEARDVLERAAAGVAVPPGDADALRIAIIELSRDPARGRAMGRSGAEFVEREFSRRTWARRYLDLFDTLVRPRPATTAVMEGPVVN